MATASTQINKILVRHTDELPPPINNSLEGISIDTVLQAAQETSQDEDLFLKPKKFAHQAEHRLVWHMDKIIAENITIQAPEARKYCNFIKGSDIG